MEPQISFYNEIYSMMIGFGDSYKPNPETVRLVENIVLKQLRQIIQEALKYCVGDYLKGEELVFLMRHNKHKMRRFVKYLQNKHTKNILNKIQTATVETGEVKSELLDFIERLDETGEFTDLSELDEVKYERQLRADRISQTLDEKKYLEFAKARSVSFTSKGSVQKSLERLRLWVCPYEDIKFKPNALDVLSYYAYQTLAEIVDYALLVRMDNKSGTDPIKHLTGSYFTSTMFNGEHRRGGTKDFTSVYSGQPPISVNEIKEVMRRVYSPQAGLLNFGGKIPETHYLFAL